MQAKSDSAAADRKCRTDLYTRSIQLSSCTYFVWCLYKKGSLSPGSEFPVPPIQVFLAFRYSLLLVC